MEYERVSQAIFAAPNVIVAVDAPYTPPMRWIRLFLPMVIGGCSIAKPTIVGKWETSLSPDLGTITQEFKPDGTMVSTTKFSRLNATYKLDGATLSVTSKRLVVVDEDTGKVETFSSGLQPPYSLQVEITRDTLTETARNKQITVWHRR
jgi:hypothetical protein